jgi:hypothetical protein
MLRMQCLFFICIGTEGSSTSGSGSCNRIRLRGRLSDRAVNSLCVRRTSQLTGLLPKRAVQTKLRFQADDANAQGRLFTRLSTDFVDNRDSCLALLSLKATLRSRCGCPAKNLRLTAAEKFEDTFDITLRFHILILSLPEHHIATHSGACNRCPQAESTP